MSIVSNLYISTQILEKKTISLIISFFDGKTLRDVALEEGFLAISPLINSPIQERSDCEFFHYNNGQCDLKGADSWRYRGSGNSNTCVGRKYCDDSYNPDCRWEARRSSDWILGPHQNYLCCSLLERDHFWQLHRVHQGCHGDGAVPEVLPTEQGKKKAQMKTF